MPDTRIGPGSPLVLTAVEFDVLWEDLGLGPTPAVLRLASRGRTRALVYGRFALLLAGCTAPLKPQTAADKTTPPQLGACYDLMPKDT